LFGAVSPHPLLQQFWFYSCIAGIIHSTLYMHPILTLNFWGTSLLMFCQIRNLYISISVRNSDPVFCCSMQLFHNLQ
jgi:lipid-A-disaccharide synthase-like uncharacterized protein